ncbi:MAG: exodeoxyribonuclease VII small subunit [Synergistetes bacterium HGW-Synergistetes-2]|nr:MAG: exodeoxyribonuclease VII small subunit [Synergistetes bacterium HGW-Synergistetes-2]
MSFSAKMDELEGLVARIEKEALPLEDALALFEKGVGLVRECRAYLSEAKQRILLLTEDSSTTPFVATYNNDEESSR